MPRRTNVFQKAIYLAQKVLMPGSTVVESAMLPDSITGLSRPLHSVRTFCESSVSI